MLRLIITIALVLLLGSPAVAARKAKAARVRPNVYSARKNKPRVYKRHGVVRKTPKIHRKEPA